MQISRHWRMNSVRYRLQGVRYENGQVSLQNRPYPLVESQQQVEEKSIEVVGWPTKVSDNALKKQS